MPTSPALIAIDRCQPAGPRKIDEAIRALVALVNHGNHDASFQGSCARTEEILLDTEVDGSRYLLVRMPQPGAERIRLSPREQEIVRMVAKGHPNKVIADVLNISSWTVCTHLRRIFAKLGVGSRAAMVAQMLEIGALTPEHRVPSNFAETARK